MANGTGSRKGKSRVSAHRTHRLSKMPCVVAESPTAVKATAKASRRPSGYAAVATCAAAVSPKPSVVTMRGRSQITIPASIKKALGLEEGDQFEATVRDGGIFLVPVVRYPRAVVEQLQQIAKKAEEHMDELKAYTNVDEMFDDLGIET
jgi:AbrB family looped-hinge helix DNA binding protein